MSSNRGRAKQIEKKKRKRAIAKKSRLSAAAALAESSLLRRAADFPIDRSFLSASWKDDNLEAPELVTAVVSRRTPAGLLVGTALVDRTCLGVKDGHARLMSPVELEHLISDELLALEPVDPQTCLSVVHHAIHFARTLGFEPHRDFSLQMFSPAPDPLLATPLAHVEKPVFISGPHDDAAAIIGKLTRAVGSSFDCKIVHPDGDVTDLADLRRTGDALARMVEVDRLLKQERVADAEKICREVLEAVPELPFPYFGLARVLRAKGDEQGAEQAEARATAIVEAARPADDDDFDDEESEDDDTG
jgi:hypothetical protein